MAQGMLYSRAVRKDHLHFGFSLREAARAAGRRPAVEIFCSYSHSDEEFRRSLEKHLEGLRRTGYVRIWHDRQIDAGAEWTSEIDSHLYSANIILLLISADFMASDYCMNIEMARALERHERGEARVIPVILRPVDWQIGVFAKLQALPTGGRPVTQWRDQDEAFHNVAIGIRRIIEGFVTGYVTGANPALSRHPEIESEQSTQKPAESSARISPRSFPYLIAILAVIILACLAWWRFGRSAKTTIKTKSHEGISYVWVPPGTYDRGCADSTRDCAADEKPRRRITLDYGFWIGQTPVTVEAYRRLMHDAAAMVPAPPFPQQPKDPIVNVTWQEARDFCQRVGGRLPFEAEWEFAARAGESDSKVMGWFVNNSGNRTHTVATLPPNAWMIYDLFGNASEWCLDWYDPRYYTESPSVNPQGPDSGTERVVRGGSWSDRRVGSPSRRSRRQPTARSDSIGFRCVLP